MNESDLFTKISAFIYKSSFDKTHYLYAKQVCFASDMLFFTYFLRESFFLAFSRKKLEKITRISKDMNEMRMKMESLQTQIIYLKTSVQPLLPLAGEIA